MSKFSANVSSYFNNYDKDDKALTPITKDYDKEFLYLVADIETSKWVNFICVGLYDGEMFEYYENYGEFFDAIMIWARAMSGGNSNLFWRDTELYDPEEQEEYTERTMTVPVFVHNGGRYDFNFFMKYIFESDDECLTFKDGIPIGSSILNFTARYEIAKHTYVEITFWDSTKLLPFSLGSLTKSFDVEHKKLEIEYKAINSVTLELIKYLEHDCRGHYEVLQKFFSWPMIKKVGPRFTMAGQALQVFRSFLEAPIPRLSYNQDEFVRKSYFGGRTEIFKPYFFSDKEYLKAYDVNSLYPHIMENSVIHYEPDEFTMSYDSKKFGFYDCLVEVPYMKIPPLPAIVTINKSEKLIFGYGEMRGIWGTNELEYAKSLGCKIKKVYKGLTFKKGGRIFKDFVNTLYKMRIDAKAKGDDVTQILCKLLLNSSYGRFGISADKEKMIIDPIREVEGIVIKNEIGDIQIGEMWSEKKEKLLPVYIKLSAAESIYEGFSNVAIASQVTSNARILMHKFYMEDPDAVYYTDTDSIYTTREFKSDPNTLGALKFEGQAKRACFILPKTYIVEKETEKGVKKEIRMKGFSTKGDSYDDLRVENDEIDTMNEDELLDLRRDTLKEAITSKSKMTKEEALRLSYISNGSYKQSVNEFTIDDFFNYLEGDQRLAALQAPKFGTFKASVRKKKLVTMLDASIKVVKSRYDKRTIVKKGSDYDTEPLELFVENDKNMVKS